MEEVYEFLKACGTYFIATEEDGQPRVRPFGTINIFEGKLYFQTGKKKAVAKQLKANPKIEICAMSQDGRWLRLSGKAILDENIAAQTDMLEHYPELTGMYQPGDGNNEVYYITDAKAQICSFTAPAKIITF